MVELMSVLPVLRVTDLDRSIEFYGQILGFEAREGWTGWEDLRALIPEAEMGDLIVELRSATAGVGAFESRFDHLAELSGRAADQVANARRRAG